MNRRILVIDDMAELHTDYRHVLAPSVQPSDSDSLAADILGSETSNAITRPDFTIDCVSQGEEGLQMVEKALAEGKPYAAAFVDVRMPPGWDGIETIKHIWQVDPELQVTIVTAYSDYSWERIRQDLGETDQLLVLKKPFESIEVLQIASALTHKWNLMQSLKEKEEKLKESSSKFRDLYDHSPDMYGSVDADTAQVRSCNQTLANKLGYAQEEIIGRPIFDLYHPDCMDKVHEAFQAFVTTGEVCNAELQLKKKNGEKIDVNLNVSSVRDENGKVLYSRSCWIDVSDRKRLEERERLLLDSTAEGIYGLDMEGNCTLVNKQCLILLGYKTEDEVLGKNMHDVIHHTRNDGTHYPVEECHIYEAFQKGEGTHIVGELLWRKDGTSFPSEYSSFPMRQGGEIIGSVVSFSDITERQQNEGQIRKLSEALAQSGEAIAITDLDGNIEYVNPAFSEITGYSEAEALGGNPRILKSGNQDARFYEQMWITLTAGRSWRGKVVNRAKNGEFYPAALTISPIRNESGEATHYIGVQQSLKEYEELEEQFHQAQKMEAIGTLVGGIAHDFNNTLAGIVGNLFLAKKAAAYLPDVVSRLDVVEKLSLSAASTIQQLLAFSRKGIVQMNPLSISSFLKETIKLNQVSLPENVEFQLSVNANDMQVHGDINQLQQMLMNLINNSFDAVENNASPLIQVELERFNADAEFMRKHDGTQVGEYACISVIDNGTGINGEHLEHIFEPFFTTKEPDKGTGLGLAMVYGVVKTHAGTIDVISSPEGTKVMVYLPLLLSKEDVELDDHEDAIIEGHGETILLVDDNATVLEAGRDVLEGLGYKVLTAVDGVCALEVFQIHKDEIDMLILDVVMPRLGGPDVLQAIRDSKPDMKAMFATGYDKLSTLGVRGKEIKELVISKPFTVTELSQAVRKVLAAKR